MSLIGKIQTLFSDKEKTTPVFPRTKVSAVSDENGVGLDVLLENMQNSLNDIDLRAENIIMASGTDLETTLAGCQILFVDENGNPTDEPYIHWNVDESGAIVNYSLPSAEEGEF